MVKAYICLVTRPENTKAVYAAIVATSLAKEVNEVLGPYDILVEVEAPSLSDVPEIVTKIRGIEGIESTLTLSTFPKD